MNVKEKFGILLDTYRSGLFAIGTDNSVNFCRIIWITIQNVCQTFLAKNMQARQHTWRFQMLPGTKQKHQ